MHEIHASFRVQIFLAVLWLSAANLLFLTTFSLGCIENQRHHQLPSSLIPATSLSALSLATKMQGYWYLNTMHWELINSHWGDPIIYKPDDIGFACHAVQSDASKGQVGKLEFSFTGPWQVISSADCGLYNIEHCHHPTWWLKKHTADLTPYPAELIPFKLIKGPDTQYSRLHKPIDRHPFKEAGISGFLPPQPFKVPAKFFNIDNHTDFWWPTLSELNNNLDY
jgi:hypothetical protein